jgi:protein-disulfide isomerase
VQRDFFSGIESGVNATPAFFIGGGHRYDGLIKFERRWR